MSGQKKGVGSLGSIGDMFGESAMRYTLDDDPLAAGLEAVSGGALTVKNTEEGVTIVHHIGGYASTR